MAEQRQDNNALEEAIAKFREDKERDSYVKVMELLERSIVLVPAMPPKDLPAEIMEQMQAGKPVKLPKEAKILPCLLRKETGEQALPIFTSPAQIPPDKKSPMVVAMPFMGVISMVSANQDKVSEVVVNPFTGIMVLNQSILEIAEKRRKAAGQIKTVQVTKEQFQELAHNRMALSLLPKYLFEKGEEGLKKLQQEEGEFLMSLYEEIYPKGQKPSCQPDDFSLMTLNITDTVPVWICRMRPQRKICATGFTWCGNGMRRNCCTTRWKRPRTAIRSPKSQRTACTRWWRMRRITGRRSRL